MTKPRRRSLAVLGALGAGSLMLTTQALTTQAANGTASHIQAGDRATPPVQHPAGGEDPGWMTPQSIHGTGHFTLHGPGIEGDRITFRLHGRMARTSITHGSFAFRHHSPAEPGEPAWTTGGVGEIGCLRVAGHQALLTTVVSHESDSPDGDEPQPHAFYLKITDGSPGSRDRVTMYQGPPPAFTTPGEQQTFGCEDPDEMESWIGEPPIRERLDAGDWRLVGPAA